MEVEILRLHFEQAEGSIAVGTLGSVTIENHHGETTNTELATILQERYGAVIIVPTGLVELAQSASVDSEPEGESDDDYSQT